MILLEISLPAIAAALISAAALLVTVIGIWVSANKTMALTKQYAEFQKERIDKLENDLKDAKSELHKRIDDHENEIVEKINEMLKMIHQIDLKLVNR